MTETSQNYIDGEWRTAETGDTFDTQNPADTSETVGTYQRSSGEDAVTAIETAAATAPEWARVPGPERGEYLRQTARLLEDRMDELTELLTREEGKTLAEAGGEVQRAVDIFYYYAGKARDVGGTVSASSARDRNLYSLDEPVGVASIITPWNYPIAIPSWKIAPALAAGNAVVFKPASLAPGVGVQIVECLAEAGVPDGVVNLVTGPGGEVGEPLATHEAIDAVSFTGSTQVGTSLYEQATSEEKRVQTEMGGKNPTLVMPSADLDTATEIVGVGAFGVTGQACTACSRALVHEEMYDEFLERIVEYADSLEVGPGLEESDMGPQVSEGELESTLDYIEIGQDEGATLETGGENLSEGDLESGYFVSPTVFSDVDSEMRIAQEEIFGPVLSVIPVEDFEHGLEVANGVEYGLSASIVTQDHEEANRFVRDVEAGVAKVNEKTTGIELHVPFGGFKQSSSETFREQGDAGLDFFTISKTVYDNF